MPTGNYARASILAAMLFFSLLTGAIFMRELAPTPPELDEQPILLARRVAAAEVFASVYLLECEAAALEAIKPGFRQIARRTGLYSTEAFAPAIACLDARLAKAGLGSVERQLRANLTIQPLLDLQCVGDLRQSDLCLRAFAYAKNRGKTVGVMLSNKLGEAEASVPS